MIAAVLVARIEVGSIPPAASRQSMSVVAGLSMTAWALVIHALLRWAHTVLPAFIAGAKPIAAPLRRDYNRSRHDTSLMGSAPAECVRQ